MTRFVIDAPTLVHLVDEALQVHPDHQLVAPGAIRSQALQLLYELGNRRRMAICLFGLAALDLKEGALERALILIGAVDPMSEAGGIQLAPVDQAEYERAVVEIRSRLGDAEIERLRQSGREMQLEQVLALAFSKTPAGVDSV